MSSFANVLSWIQKLKSQLLHSFNTMLVVYLHTLYTLQTLLLSYFLHIQHPSGNITGSDITTNECILLPRYNFRHIWKHDCTFPKFDWQLLVDVLQYACWWTPLWCRLNLFTSGNTKKNGDFKNPRMRCVDLLYFETWKGFLHQVNNIFAKHFQSCAKGSNILGAYFIIRLASECNIPPFEGCRFTMSFTRVQFQVFNFNAIPRLKRPALYLIYS